ncbi:MAG: hypothetical protein ACUZ8E_10765, partial [Candidatus Anammoxibacter sp.]
VDLSSYKKLLTAMFKNSHNLNEKQCQLKEIISKNSTYPNISEIRTIELGGFPYFPIGRHSTYHNR